MGSVGGAGAGQSEPSTPGRSGPTRSLAGAPPHALRPTLPRMSAAPRHRRRSVTPWLVVTGHRPLYVSSTNNWSPDGDQPAGAEARGALEQLLLDARVDLTLHGHHHSYQVSGGWAGYRCRAAVHPCPQKRPNLCCPPSPCPLSGHLRWELCRARPTSPGPPTPSPFHSRP